MLICRRAPEPSAGASRHGGTPIGIFPGGDISPAVAGRGYG